MLGLLAIRLTLWLSKSCLLFWESFIFCCANLFLVCFVCSLMARVKKTTKLIDSSEAVDSSSDVVVSFEFGLSRVTLRELDELAKLGWFSRDLARPSEGEVVPDPREDEVVVFMKFFLVGLRFPLHALVVGVLKRFNLKFHQLNPSSFVKLCIYVWGYKSQGVEMDL